MISCVLHGQVQQVYCACIGSIISRNGTWHRVRCGCIYINGIDRFWNIIETSISILLGKCTKCESYFTWIPNV